MALNNPPRGGTTGTFTSATPITSGHGELCFCPGRGSGLKIANIRSGKLEVGSWKLKQKAGWVSNQLERIHLTPSQRRNTKMARNCPQRRYAGDCQDHFRSPAAKSFRARMETIMLPAEMAIIATSAPARPIRVTIAQAAAAKATSTGQSHSRFFTKSRKRKIAMRSPPEAIAIAATFTSRDFCQTSKMAKDPRKIATAASEATIWPKMNRRIEFSPSLVLMVRELDGSLCEPSNTRYADIVIRERAPRKSSGSSA